MQSTRLFLEKAQRVTHELSEWCPGEGQPKRAFSITYFVPPLRKVPLNLNVYFRDCPTIFGGSYGPSRPPMSLILAIGQSPARRSRQCARLESRVWFPVFVRGSIPHRGRPAAPIRERSLYTGEVVGSIPTAPTIFQAIIGSIPAVAGRTIRKRARKIGAKSVQSVPNASARGPVGCGPWEAPAPFPAAGH
jgi:hypothetical protein